MINLLIIDNFKSISWLEMPLSKFNCLVGMNGAGKSTLMAALAGELSLSGGRIELDGRALQAWPAAELAQRRALNTPDRIRT